MIKGAKANVLEAIGNTPIVQLSQVGKDLDSELYAKLEFVNPGGSIKDRLGLRIIEDAENAGLIQPGGTIVEATSGNTGMGLAIAGALKGYRCIFVMPDKMSNEKVQNLRAFGAKVVIAPTAVEPEDPRSYYSVAKRLVEETPNAFYANQYHNPSNPKMHYEWTAPELWAQVGDQVDAIVIGMGTGGTISGIGKFYKEKKRDIKIIGVDPIGSLYFEYFKTGKLGEAHSYLTEGIGEDFLPTTMHFDVVDEVVQVTDKESLNMTRHLLKQEGIFSGPSSGAAVMGALKYAANLKSPEKILIILPDSGNRYLSKVFNDDWMRENSMLEAEGAFGIIGDLLRFKGVREVMTISPDECAGDVIGKMKKYGISQFPVVKDTELVGILAESDLVYPLFEGRVGAKDSIEPLIRTTFSRLGPNDPVSNLTQVFESGSSCVVLDGTRICGIVTKIDLISFLSGQMQKERLGNGRI